MSAFCVRTIPVENWEKIAKSPFKLEMFRQFFLPKCPNQALAYLGEFLDGGEYSEEVLDMFLSGDDLKGTVMPNDETKESGNVIPFPENTIHGGNESSRPLRP